MTIIVDTGPLVALIDPDSHEHEWAEGWSRRLPKPWLTSEPVLTEAAFLLARDGFDADELFALADAGLLRVGLQFEAERASLRQLMARYRNVPMTLADATLVRLAELHQNSKVVTLDADFRIYRRNRTGTISVLLPDEPPPSAYLSEPTTPYRVKGRATKKSR